MKKFLVVPFLSLIATLSGENAFKAEAQKIHAHLLINDVLSACEEAQACFLLYPNSIPILEAYIKALAQTNDDKSLWKIWSVYSRIAQDPYQNRELLETMSWGIISSGYSSSSPIIRTMAILGAFFGQDAKGVKILCKGMRDHNSFIRAITVKLSSHLRDARLCDEIIRMFHEERSWNVKMEVIKAVGQMKLQQARPLLMNMIESASSTADEKAKAVSSMVELLDTAQTSDIKRLAGSNRFGLRLLACQLLESFELNDELHIVDTLLHDSHAEVRTAALHAIGSLRINLDHSPPLLNKTIQLLQDSNHEVQTMAAWTLTLYQSNLAAPAFNQLLNHENPEIRQRAAAALSATGMYGQAILLDAFKNAKDPYVRMNLALGLIMQRTNTIEACQTLYEGLMMKERLMWDESGYFKTLLKSDIKHDDTIPNLPENINQITRLEILNILFVMKFPKAQEALISFLQQKTQGITGLASALMLTEGNEEAISIVESLLTNPDKKIKIQAALVLAIWGRGERAIQVLQDAYAESDRTTKERILEGLGRIGSSATIPFLVEKLQEPSQSLRIIAAAALLECLNH